MVVVRSGQQGRSGWAWPRADQREAGAEGQEYKKASHVGLRSGVMAEPSVAPGGSA